MRIRYRGCRSGRVRWRRNWERRERGRSCHPGVWITEAFTLLLFVFFLSFPLLFQSRNPSKIDHRGVAGAANVARGLHAGVPIDELRGASLATSHGRGHGTRCAGLARGTGAAMAHDAFSMHGRGESLLVSLLLFVPRSDCNDCKGS